MKLSSYRACSIGISSLALLLAAAAPAMAMDQQQNARGQQGMQQSSAYQLTDENISAAVERRLSRASGLQTEQIEVRTQNGQVMLSGQVMSLPAKNRAIELAQAVRGVKDVQSQLKVTPGQQRQGQELQQDITKSLQREQDLQGQQIQAQAQQGQITLQGTVSSPQQKMLAERAAERVPGVTEVKNQLQVKSDKPLSDDQLSSRIRQSFQADPRLSQSMPTLQVQNRTVTLKGEVESAQLKQRAIEKSQLAGAEQVKADQLQVNPQLAQAREQQQMQGDQTTAMHTDPQVEEAVRDSFWMQPSLWNEEIAVSSRNGLITLRGTVDTLAEKWRAENSARGVAGVRRLRNMIQIKADERMPSPRAIKDEIVEAFAWSWNVDGGDIDVDVQNDGTVTMSGMVDSLDEKRDAAWAVADVEGVRRIRNNLEMATLETGRQAELSDAELEEEIRDDLWWSVGVDSDRIDVQVQNGQARLSGLVEDREAMREAIQLARSAGADRVINNLRLEQMGTGQEGEQVSRGAGGQQAQGRRMGGDQMN